MEGNLKEKVSFLGGNFAEKKELGRKPHVPKVEALSKCSRIFITRAIVIGDDVP